MPWVTVTLKPGLNTELTPAALESGYSAMSCWRFRNGMFQKIGGWQKLFATTLVGLPRHAHAWEDLANNNRLAISTTTRLYDYTDSTLTNISPQVLITNPTIDFTTTIGSPVVTITDTGVGTITPYDSVFFNTPVSVDGIILSGAYAVTAYIASTKYQITASSNGVAGVTSGGAVPAFTTLISTATVTVTIPAHGLVAGDDVVFPISTSVGGITIYGRYIVQSWVDANNFTVTASSIATSSAGPTSMNSGKAQLSYSLTQGPVPVGTAYGTGLYGAGAYGLGVTTSGQSGTAITSSDSTLDNWGELLVMCPDGGGIYYWGPSSGYANPSLIAEAPYYNTGAFVAISVQQIIAYGSAENAGIGQYQDPLLIRWCDVGNFFDWTDQVTNQAGSYRIPNGSRIIGAVAGPAATNYVWTDVALWEMNYIGSQFVWGFTKIADNCGLIAKHAHAELGGAVFWRGASNFFVMSGGAIEILPCPVWDAVFQDFDEDNKALCHAGSNMLGTEVLFFQPSSAGLGYCDVCVKYNIMEKTWDIVPDGSFSQRNTWIDKSILSNPVAVTNAGVVYSHESGYDADNNPIGAWFKTGYFVLNNGQDVSFIDRIYPDFRWGEYDGSDDATIQVTVYTARWPGDTVVEYGPFTVTKATPFISKRIRGRYIMLKVMSSDAGSFWRMGAVKVRWAPDGRGTT
jgi:hypothetical protein